MQRSAEECAADSSNSSVAFAAILGDGSVVTWGDPARGGDSEWCARSAEERAADFKQLSFAFAAILGDGSVVTWGNARFGGDSSGVRDQLTNLQQI